MADMSVMPVAEASLTPLYAMVGSVVVAQLVGGLVAVFKWMGSRTVEQEDKDKESLKAALEKHEERFEELEDAVNKMVRALDKTEISIGQMTTSVSTMHADVGSLRSTLDAKLEKQGDVYKTQLEKVMTEVTAKLEKVEYDLRQDTTRAINDAKMQLTASQPKRKR